MYSMSSENRMMKELSGAGLMSLNTPVWIVFFIVAFLLFL